MPGRTRRRSRVARREPPVRGREMSWRGSLSFLACSWEEGEGGEPGVEEGEEEGAEEGAEPGDWAGAVEEGGA